MASEIIFRTLRTTLEFGSLIRPDIWSSPDDLLATAQRRTRTHAQPREPFEPALRALLKSIDDEARLSAFGRIATRRDLAGKLANLLILDAREAEDPSIIERDITAPVFITGLPRSGTTFLHALLACASSAQIPLAWQTAFPTAHPRAGRQRFARSLAVFARLVPELASLHPLSADSPQECTEILAHTFRSLRFDTTHHVPAYREWLDRAGHDEAYRFHRRFLQHLQGNGRPRWILKSPDHIAALPALRRTYPDARLILVHRDPLRVMASVARLTELLRRPFTREVDRHSIGQQVLRDWTSGLRTILDIDDALHVRHIDLINDPIATARRVCDEVGLELDPSDQRRMLAYVAEHPRGGYGENRYRLEDYGITAAAMEPIRSEYLARFGLPREDKPVRTERDGSAPQALTLSVRGSAPNPAGASGPRPAP